MLKLDVIGDPIDHSLSPVIHCTALDTLGEPYEYRRVRVKKGELEKYIRQAKEDGILGFNLTMPHKTDILPYLDYIQEEALLYNSVNTVHIKNGKLFGYNTDDKGFVCAMEELGFSPKGKHIAILGAGGVASTLALKSELEDAKKITVLNRTLSSAENITKSLKISSHALTLTLENLQNTVSDCDILVNATPLGMTGIAKNFDDLSFMDNLKSGALVYDLIYNPEETKFLKAARVRGFKTLNGMGMLIYQGLLADRIFFDGKHDFFSLKEKIEIKLKNLKK